MSYFAPMLGRKLFSGAGPVPRVVCSEQNQPVQKSGQIRKGTRASLLLAALLGWIPMQAQYTTQTILDYIDEWWPVAVAEMQESGIPASISLAQGILESGAGTSELAKKSNNHFGIKCHKEWTGKKVYYNDDAPNECFRQYNDQEESWEDHGEFLQTRDRYASLFDLKSDDYKGWAYGLKKAGYATNPRYPDLLIKLITDYNLDQYDQGQMASSGGPRRQKPGEPDTPGPAISSEVFWFNRIPTVLARQGDHPIDIAERQDVALLRLCDYNDFEPEYSLETGEKVYLKPKRRKAAERYHVVKPGETMRDIAQAHGVRLDLLATRNLVTTGFLPATGERIELRGKAPRPPKAAPKPAAKPVEKPDTRPAIAGNAKPASEQTASGQTGAIHPGTGQNGASHTAANQTATKPSANQPATKPAAAQTQTAKPAAAQTPTSQPITTTRPAENKTTTTVPGTAATPGEYIAVDEAPSTPATLALPVGNNQHEVAQGDTLYNISRRYNITVDQLKDWNQLPDNNIKIGQRLVVRK